MLLFGVGVSGHWAYHLLQNKNSRSVCSGLSYHMHPELWSRTFHDLLQMLGVHHHLRLVPPQEEGQDTRLCDLGRILGPILLEAVGEPLRRVPVQGSGQSPDVFGVVRCEALIDCRRIFQRLEPPQFFRIHQILLGDGGRSGTDRPGSVGSSSGLDWRPHLSSMRRSASGPGPAQTGTAWCI